MKKPEALTSPSMKSKPVRGKYTNLLQQGTNLVILDPALMPFFPDSASVNKALRAYLEIETTVGNAALHGRSQKKITLPPEPDVSFDPRTGARPKPQPRSRKAA